jgi:hypothetical protein
MTAAAWRIACASVIGTSHSRLAQPCQDACHCEVLAAGGDEPVLVALAADGAGSAPRAEIGSALACSLLRREIVTALASGLSPGSLTREFVTGMVRGAGAAIAARAEGEGRRPRDFATTVLGAVVAAEEAVFFQVGDGAIVVSTPGEDGEFGWIFWPESGEYENTTFFLTDPDMEDHLQWEHCARACDRVALFSDGLQRLALHFLSRTAHAPFFRSMMQAIEAAADDSPEVLSRELALHLSSPAVNARTDDDKTLILATRRRSAVPPASDDGAEALR